VKIPFAPAVCPARTPRQELSGQAGQAGREDVILADRRRKINPLREVADVLLTHHSFLVSKKKRIFLSEKRVEAAAALTPARFPVGEG
jgi:hypothetical protein